MPRDTKFSKDWLKSKDANGDYMRKKKIEEKLKKLEQRVANKKRTADGVEPTTRSTIQTSSSASERETRSLWTKPCV